MKTVDANEAKLEWCLRAAKKERIVITRDGKPVAMVVGVSGLDMEQIELGTSDKFWKLIRERRKEKTISHAELERRLERSPKLIKECEERWKSAQRGEVVSLEELKVRFGMVRRGKGVRVKRKS